MTGIVGMDSSQDGKPWERSLGDFLVLAVQRSPDKVFVEIAGQSITYCQFQDRVFQTAGMFRRRLYV